MTWQCSMQAYEARVYAGAGAVNGGCEEITGESQSPVTHSPEETRL